MSKSWTPSGCWRADRGRALDAATQTLALSAIDSFSAGVPLALVVFGVHLWVLGLLLYRSR